MNDDVKKVIDNIDSYDSLKRAFIGLLSEKGQLDRNDLIRINSRLTYIGCDNRFAGITYTPEDLMCDFPGISDKQLASEIALDAIDYISENDDLYIDFLDHVRKEIKLRGFDPAAAEDGRLEPVKTTSIKR